MMRSAAILAAVLTLPTQFSPMTRAAEPVSQTTYNVGVAKIDITPSYPVRLAGFGFRRTESEGVTQKIGAAALAIDDGGDPLVLITADLCGVPGEFTDKLARRLANSGVKPDRLTLAVTHSHTTPMVDGYLRTLFGQPIPPEHQDHIERFTRELLENLERVAKDALADRKPANLSWGIGTVGFAKNRRTPNGPTDHDLPVLTVRDPNGKLRAVWTSYACHCVTLSNNKISGDWAGFAKETIEAEFPGAVALVSVGCGADQNPNSGVTGDKVEVATAQGRELAAEVKRLVGGFLRPVTGPIEVHSQHLELPLVDPPPRSVWEEKANNKDPKQAAAAYHAKAQLARLDRGEALTLNVTYVIKVWLFGESLAIAFLPGEDVVDYSLRIKKELDNHRIWINAYCNSVPCYIPSERVLKEGGYEAGGAMLYYDLPGPLKPGLENRIFAATRHLIGRGFRRGYDPTKTASPPLSPQQSLSTIRTRPGMVAELMAAEPLVTSPVAIAFGPDGRLWVAEMYDYPSGTDGNYQPGGRIRVLSSSRGDGRYDRSTVFLDKIPFPTGVTVWRNGVLICAAPDILYAEEVRDPASGTASAPRVVVKKLFSGFGTENYQARVNSLEYGLDGWVYGSCGLFGGTITSFTGKKLELGNRDFRIKPDTGEIEPATGRTQQGRVRDDWDNWFGCDNSNLAWHYPLPDHYIRRNPHAAPPNPAVSVPSGDDPTRLYPASEVQLFKLSGPPGRPTAVCGLGVYRDDLLGKDVTGDLFACEPVNLLIHRMKLVPKGSTFAGIRPTGEEQTEFLTSTDPWFRPVQVRTGPDGCLWVVDMHRYVIEHPRWIPSEDLAKVDVRAGATLGRIFRIRPTDREPRPFPRLDKLDNAGLVAGLDTPNGCVRDLAMQMLLWRNAKEAGFALTKFARACPRPEGRLYALCTLDCLDALHDSTVAAFQSDHDPHVQRHALRLLDTVSRRDPKVIVNLPSAVSALDPQVRLQYAFSLAERADSSSTAIYYDLIRDFPSDPYLLAALASSLRPENVESALEATSAVGFDRVSPTFVRALLTTGLENPGAVGRTIRGLARRRPSRQSITALTSLLEAFEHAGRSVEAVVDSETMATVQRVVVEARRIATDDKAEVKDRKAAVALLGRDAADEKVLLGLLSPNQPTEIQSGAATALARVPGNAGIVALLVGWSSYSPGLKSQAVGLATTIPGGEKCLLDAIEAKQIPASQIDAPTRQRLVSAKNAPLRQRAEKLLATTMNPDRQKVLSAHQDVLSLPADARHGRAVFGKSCSVCHRLENVGHEVGPDLAQLQNKSPAYLLQEILDPNRNVDSRYVEYRASTKAGRDYSGLVAAESATSVTLRSQEGRETVLLRNEIESLDSTGRSLMPEGFEKDLSRQDLADLLAYIGSPHGAAAKRPAP